jgi:hypothetical protein
MVHSSPLPPFGYHFIAGGRTFSAWLARSRRLMTLIFCSLLGAA